MELLDFKKYTIPVIKALDKMDVRAELSGRNDLPIDGKKFSGNAQYIYKGRLLHHGTLLLDSELDRLQNALNVKMDKIVSKSVKSVRSRAANIKEYLENDITINEFKSLLLKYVFEFQELDFDEYELTEVDIENIREMMEQRYLTWDWNYGQSPSFNFKNSKRFGGGKVEILLEVKDGIINECKIYGDFLGVGEIGEVEEKIRGLKYTENDIKAILDKIDVYKYFGGITVDKLISCFFA